MSSESSSKTAQSARSRAGEYSSSAPVPQFRLAEPAGRYQRFSLFECSRKFFVLGCDLARSRFKLLEIDRTNPEEFRAHEYSDSYSWTEACELINQLSKTYIDTWKHHEQCQAIIGFPKFLDTYYILFVTKRKVKATIAGMDICCVEGSSMIPFSSSRSKSSPPEESKYRSLFGITDLTKGFYYSYCYQLKRTLQSNMGGQPRADVDSSRYVWNHSLLDPGIKAGISEWCAELIHGFIDQVRCSMFGRVVSLILIARRSRHFAGTRYRKRGLNVHGQVANEVETEQIVHDESFGSSTASPGYSSFVQIRGSIPLFWQQITDLMVPKPKIDLNHFDPLYLSTARHFADMLARYGGPIHVINLIKQKEKKLREVILFEELTKAIDSIQRHFPGRCIEHIPLDFHRLTKEETPAGVFQKLMDMAKKTVSETGFFHACGNAYATTDSPTPSAGRQQRGIARSNCIDCLDRTNVAQYIIAISALAHQLAALGILHEPSLDPEVDIAGILMGLFENMGNQLALQYVGSLAHDKLSAAHDSKKGGGKVRKLFITLNRYYSNTFTDAEKQQSMDLFLGQFIPTKGGLPIWDCEDTSFAWAQAAGPRKILPVGNCPSKTWVNTALAWHDAGSNEETKSLAAVERHSWVDSYVEDWEIDWAGYRPGGTHPTPCVGPCLGFGNSVYGDSSVQFRGSVLRQSLSAASSQRSLAVDRESQPSSRRTTTIGARVVHPLALPVHGSSQSSGKLFELKAELAPACFNGGKPKAIPGDKAHDGAIQGEITRQGQQISFVYKAWELTSFDSLLAGPTGKVSECKIFAKTDKGSSNVLSIRRLVNQRPLRFGGDKFANSNDEESRAISQRSQDLSSDFEWLLKHLEATDPALENYVNLVWVHDAIDREDDPSALRTAEQYKEGKYIFGKQTDEDALNSYVQTIPCKSSSDEPEKFYTQYLEECRNWNAASTTAHSFRI